MYWFCKNKRKLKIFRILSCLPNAFWVFNPKLKWNWKKTEIMEMHTVKMFTVFTVMVVVLFWFKLLDQMNIPQNCLNLAKSIALRSTVQLVALLNVVIIYNFFVEVFVNLNLFFLNSVTEFPFKLLNKRCLWMGCSHHERHWSTDYIEWEDITVCSALPYHWCCFCWWCCCLV